MMLGNFLWFQEDRAVRKTLLLALLCVLAAIPTFATELLQNPGFETGVLSPWYQARDFCNGDCVNWAVTDSNSHSGTYSTTVTGNIELRQDFTPTPGADITNVSFWAIANVLIVRADFFYSDSSDEEFTYQASPFQWTLVDATSDVDKAKTLTGFSVWGSSPSGTYYYDDFDITSNQVPEPGSLVLLGSGLLGAGGLLRRKFNL